MPDVKPGESRKDFVSRCIPIVLEDETAKDQDQAVAICSQMWRDRAKSIVMKITHLQEYSKGRPTRWRARANTGEYDLLQERFDGAFFDDVIANFCRTKEALSRGEPPPDGMTEPILDISHYSIYLPPHKRNLARAGWIDKMWRDSRVLFAQGFFDDTPLGHLAEKAALEREPEDRRVSIVVYPDYSHVEIEAGGERKIYRGGNGYAWMDSLAMTSMPCDPGAIMEVKSVSTKLAEDAAQVLGAEGAAVIAELEAERTAKTMPDGALVKSEEEKVMSENTASGTYAVIGGGENATIRTDETPTEDQDEQVTEAVLTAQELAGQLAELMPRFGEAINQRLAPMQAQLDAIAGKTEEFEAQIKALGDDKVAQVQKAIQGKGIFDQMWPDEKELSVQRSGTTETAKGNVKSPEETGPEPGNVQGAFFP